MKRVIFILIAIFVLLSVKLMGAGYAESLERWVFDPRVRVEVVDRVSENGCYNVYYCVGEQYVVTLERDLYRDEGWITFSGGDYGNGTLYYETDWGGKDASERIIHELVEQALTMVE